MDYLNGLMSQAKSQLFNLDPKLASFNPPIPSQQEFDTALEPIVTKGVNIGLGAAGLEELAPLRAASLLA